METRWACLEFTKTVGWAERDRSDDELTSYEALVGWAEREGLLGRGEAKRLRRRAAARPKDAARVLTGGVALRGVIYRIFSAVGRDQPPAESDIRALNTFLPDASRWLGLVRSDGDFEWGWPDYPEDRLDRVLWPIVRSAARLLTGGELARVRLCDADDCGWLFVDASRNRSRRWCDMSECGNRAKARRFRQRHKEDG